MTPEFREGYAEVYDLIYAEKDYSGECDLLQAAFREFYKGEVHDVLDLGCGTGGHAEVLAARGISVLGVDRSSSMINVARLKRSPAATSGAVEYRVSDIRNFVAGRSFDAVIMMFAVLGYQRTNQDVMSTLRTARSHVETGGLLVFDAWYGPAVLNLRPAERIKSFNHGQSTVLRISKGSLHTRLHLCRVDVEIWKIVEDRLLDRLHEVHEVRFFFPLELELMLSQARFRMRSLGPLSDLSSEATDEDWNVVAIAEAVP